MANLLQHADSYGSEVRNWKSLGWGKNPLTWPCCEVLRRLRGAGLQAAHIGRSTDKYQKESLEGELPKWSDCFSPVKWQELAFNERRLMVWPSSAKVTLSSPVVFFPKTNKQTKNNNGKKPC